MTNSQVRKLGDRLRSEEPDEFDLKLLEEFRASFAAPYEKVIQVLRNDLGLKPTGRSKKTTASIIAELRRLKTRLDRMQDIAGCRVVVSDIAEQDSITGHLRREFPELKIDDLRQEAHFGYRAIHAIVQVDGKPIEIQIRTVLQDLWADLCERLAYAKGIELKYGGGPDVYRLLLQMSSDEVAGVENGTSQRTRAEIEIALKRFTAPFRERAAKQNGD